MITRKRAVTAHSFVLFRPFYGNGEEKRRRKKREMLSEGTVMMKRGLEGVM